MMLWTKAVRAGAGADRPRSIFLMTRRNSNASWRNSETWPPCSVNRGHLRQRFSEVDDERSGSRLMGLIRKGAGGNGRLSRTRAAKPRWSFILPGTWTARRRRSAGLWTRWPASRAALGDLMGVEALEEPGLTPEAGTLSQAGPDPNLLGRRLAAWARVYEARPQPGPLVTDQPEVLDALDLNLARMSAAGPLDDARGFEVLEPFCAIDIPLAEADKSGDSPSDWTAFIDRVSAGTWTKRDLDGLKKEAADLAAPRAAPADAPRSDTLHLTACLLPGKTLPEALALAAGVAGGPLERDVYCGPVFCVSSH